MENKKDHSEGLLTRGVAELVDPGNVFRGKVLRKRRGEYPDPIIVKFGIDPTKPDIHLGHAVVLRKLRQLQDAGCKVVFLVGDYTAQIGDPSGKDKTRPEIEQEAINKNVETYLTQVGKILRTDNEAFSWVRNSDWFTAVTDLNLPDDYEVTMEVEVGGKKITVPVPPNSFVGKAVVFENTRMQKAVGAQEISVITLRSLLWTLRHVTHAQLLKRDMFQERMRAGQDLYMHEVLYPVLQGIDSYIINMIYGSCDLEVGGTDQTFNMLMGRDAQQLNRSALVRRGKRADLQAVLSLKLLVGTDGEEKMSKSLGNYIGITEPPNEIYGKIMSIPDSALPDYLELCTFADEEEVGDARRKKKGGTHPKEVKMRVAREVVATYHGESAAESAEERFIKTFQKREIPETIPEVKSTVREPLIDILVRAGAVPSKSEARRLVEGGAVKTSGGRVIRETAATILQTTELRIGKRKFLRIVIE